MIIIGAFEQAIHSGNCGKSLSNFYKETKEMPLERVIMNGGIRVVMTENYMLWLQNKYDEYFKGE